MALLLSFLPGSERFSIFVKKISSMKWSLKLSLKGLLIWALALVMIGCSGEKQEDMDQEEKKKNMSLPILLCRPR